MRGRPPPTKSAGRRPRVRLFTMQRSIRSSSDEQPMGSVESVLVAERHGGPSFWHALRTVRDVRRAERYFLKPKRLSLDTCGCAVRLEWWNPRTTRAAGQLDLELPIIQVERPAWAVANWRPHGTSDSRPVANGNRGGSEQLRYARPRQV